MDAALRFPGMPNIWTMPIKNRIDMLSTGIRTPIGIKVLGPDLAVDPAASASSSRRSSARSRARAASSPSARPAATSSTSTSTATRSRATGSRSRTRRRSSRRRSAARPSPRRSRGASATRVNVRYARELPRRPADGSRRVLVPTPSGAQVPLAQLADIRIVEGPAMIRNENGQLAGYVFVDMAGRDIGGYVERGEAARRRASSTLPDGLHAASGAASTRTCCACASG